MQEEEAVSVGFSRAAARSIGRRWLTADRIVELFKITCVTCQARLAVRDASLDRADSRVPECGSMVQVTAPATPGGDGATASAIGLASATAAAPSVLESAIGTSGSSARVADVSAGRAAIDSHSSLEHAADFGAELDLPTAARSARGHRGDCSRCVRSSARRPFGRSVGWAPPTMTALAVASALAGSALVVGVLAWRGSADEAPVAAPVDQQAATQSAAVVEPAPVGASRAVATDAQSTESRACHRDHRRCRDCSR